MIAFKSHKYIVYSNFSCQPDIMSLLNELNMEVYPQYIEGRKVMQLGSEKVSTYNSDIPSLPLHCLIDLHFLLKRVSSVFIFIINSISKYQTFCKPSWGWVGVGEGGIFFTHISTI